MRPSSRRSVTCRTSSRGSYSSATPPRKPAAINAIRATRPLVRPQRAHRIGAGGPMGIMPAGLRSVTAAIRLCTRSWNLTSAHALSAADKRIRMIRSVTNASTGVWTGARGWLRPDGGSRDALGMDDPWMRAVHHEHACGPRVRASGGRPNPGGPPRDVGTRSRYTPEIGFRTAQAWPLLCAAGGDRSRAVARGGLSNLRGADYARQMENRPRSVRFAIQTRKSCRKGARAMVQPGEPLRDKDEEPRDRPSAAVKASRHSARWL